MLNLDIRHHSLSDLLLFLSCRLSLSGALVFRYASLYTVITK